MRITDVRVVSSSGSVRGVFSRAARPSARQGLLLRVETPDGKVAQGEASPLPGYSSDTVEDARSALEHLDWTRIPEPDPRSDQSATCLDALAPSLTDLPPAARFAVETAWLDVLGQRAERPIWSILASDVRVDVPVPLSFMIGGVLDPDSAVRARDVTDRGAHTMKFKIDAAHFTSKEEDALCRICDGLGATRLRLDANRSVSPKSDVLERLSRSSPELVEEPVPSDALFTMLAPPLSIAFDESLQDPGFLSRIAPHLPRLRCVAVVLKPAALGGFSACLAVARIARSLGLDVTVSHLFDGPVALTAATHLAIAVGTRSRASGLALHGGLAAWPATSLPMIGATTLVAGTAPGLGLELVEGLA